MKADTDGDIAEEFNDEDNEHEGDDDNYESGAQDNGMCCLFCFQWNRLTFE